MHKSHKIFYDHIGKNHSYKSILALNGDLPSKSFFNSSLPLIAADGGVNRLNKLGLMPDVIVGDLDSADSALLMQTEVIYRPDQNSCDFEKSLDYLKSENLLPAIITGISGGMIDHIMQNMNLFLNSGCIFYAPPIVAYGFTKGVSKKFFLPLNSKISIIGINAVISSMGLKWELDNYAMDFPGANSSFNRNIEKEVTIKLHKGQAIVMIYLEKVKDSGWM